MIRVAGLVALGLFLVPCVRAGETFPYAAGEPAGRLAPPPGDVQSANFRQALRLAAPGPYWFRPERPLARGPVVVQVEYLDLDRGALAPVWTGWFGAETGEPEQGEWTRFSGSYGWRTATFALPPARVGPEAPFGLAVQEQAHVSRIAVIEGLPADLEHRASAALAFARPLLEAVEAAGGGNAPAARRLRADIASVLRNPGAATIDGLLEAAAADAVWRLAEGAGGPLEAYIQAQRAEHETSPAIPILRGDMIFDLDAARTALSPLPRPGEVVDLSEGKARHDAVPAVLLGPSDRAGAGLADRSLTFRLPPVTAGTYRLEVSTSDSEGAPDTGGVELAVRWGGKAYSLGAWRADAGDGCALTSGSGQTLSVTLPLAGGADADRLALEVVAGRFVTLQRVTLARAAKEAAPAPPAAGTVSAPVYDRFSHPLPAGYCGQARLSAAGGDLLIEINQALGAVAWHSPGDPEPSRLALIETARSGEPRDWGTGAVRAVETTPWSVRIDYDPREREGRTLEVLAVAEQPAFLVQWSWPRGGEAQRRRIVAPLAGGAGSTWQVDGGQLVPPPAYWGAVYSFEPPPAAGMAATVEAALDGAVASSARTGAGGKAFYCAELLPDARRWAVAIVFGANENQRAETWQEVRRRSFDAWRDRTEKHWKRYVRDRWRGVEQQAGASVRALSGAERALFEETLVALVGGDLRAPGPEGWTVVDPAAAGLAATFLRRLGVPAAAPAVPIDAETVPLGTLYYQMLDEWERQATSTRIDTYDRHLRTIETRRRWTPEGVLDESGDDLLANQQLYACYVMLGELAQRAGRTEIANRSRLQGASLRQAVERAFAGVWTAGDLPEGTQDSGLLRAVVAPPPALQPWPAEAMRAALARRDWTGERDNVLLAGLEGRRERVLGPILAGARADQAVRPETAAFCRGRIAAERGAVDPAVAGPALYFLLLP